MGIDSRHYSVHQFGPSQRHRYQIVCYTKSRHLLGAFILYPVTNLANVNTYQAMRGSAGSFGITTSVQVKTFPAPSSSTAFEYHWDLNVADATKGISAFQSFVQTNIPVEFGAEINLGRGSASGRVSLTVTGGWYGPAGKLNATIAPLLSQLPPNPQTTLNVGTYINSVQFFAGSQPLDTTQMPDRHDTFYAKSLMTPQSSPMSSAAINAFMNYLAYQGFVSTTVCESLCARDSV